MKTIKTLTILGMLTASIYGNFATAFWTGKSYYTQSVTGRSVVNCQYRYANYTFWRAFPTTCAASVEVE